MRAIEGWLWKKGGSGSGASPLKLGRRNWTRRYCTLEDGVLKYYKLEAGQGKPAAGDKERGSVSLTGATAMDAEIDGKEHCFAIHKGDGTMVWFRAEAALDKTRWLDYIDGGASGPKRRGSNESEAALRRSMDNLQFENEALARELEVARKASSEHSIASSKHSVDYKGVSVSSLGTVEYTSQPSGEGAAWADAKEDDEDSLSSADVGGVTETKEDPAVEYPLKTEPEAAPAPRTGTPVGRNTPSPSMERVSIQSQEFAF